MFKYVKWYLNTRDKYSLEADLNTCTNNGMYTELESFGITLPYDGSFWTRRIVLEFCLLQGAQCPGVVANPVRLFFVVGTY
uniref:Uncharacterized protein n=1 Tax=Arundo donax TaxID=35708 RepID=A0A0A9B4W4_ARUDO